MGEPLSSQWEGLPTVRIVLKMNSRKVGVRKECILPEREEAIGGVGGEEATEYY